MSSNIIFKAPGRTTTYMPIDVNTPKEEIYSRYARGSFSTENEWPYESPSAGYYDIKNSNTKLILLNNQKTWSHLRGKTKAKKEPFVKDANYDWVEKEIEMKKAHDNQAEKGKKDKRHPDPVRHFLHTSCSYKVDFESETSTSTINRKSKSVPASRIRTATTISSESNKNKEIEKALLLKYLYAIGPRTTGFQNKFINSTLPKEFTSSYNLNHPEFSSGQRLFLNNICNIYSVTKMKQHKQEQYARLLEQQKLVDRKKKQKYRLHDGENFDLYQSWLNNYERPVQHQVNCGYFFTKSSLSAQSSTNATPRRPKSSRPMNSDRKQYFSKSFDKSHQESPVLDSNEINKKSNEEELSDLYGDLYGSLTSCPSVKSDSDL